jgi:cystathionine beta-lyase/cystathionine gamma-synthase
MELSYILNQLGEEHSEYFNAVSPPIVQTSNFQFESVHALRRAFADEFSTYLYSRGNNPTVDILRKKIAALDGAEDALIFNSGASAIFCSILPFVKSGAHIVSVKSPYTWAQKMMDDILPRFGVSTTCIDGTMVENWEIACQPNTTLFYLESPNSWTYELQDLKKLAALARKKGITTLIDNSYCTPLYQRPIEMGIDLSLQSATKYIGGHSDVVGGVVSGSKDHMARIFRSEYNTTGAGATPFHAWLLLRGLRTLPLRLERIAKTTRVVLGWLKEQPWVEGVIFPFDETFPQYKLATEQMKNAAGLLSFFIKAQTVEEVEAFCNNLKHIRMAVSWGGHESLLVPRCAGMKREAFDASRPQHRLCRLYVGLEDDAYLIGDLEQASKALSFARR